MLAVDPNHKLLQIARNREGVVGLQATVAEFVARPDFPEYNKFLMCHCAHHFPDLVATFKAMLQRMPVDGRCVMLYYPAKEITLPLWKKVREMISKCDESPHKEQMIEAGLAVEVHREVVSYHVTKSFWYKWLRGRAASFFERLTDEEIEQGIAELEKTQLAGIGMEEVFEIKDAHMVAVATPPVNTT